MADKERVIRWLTSNKNIAGCVLAIGGPVLAVTGVVAPPIALALIPVLYAAGALAAPGERQPDLGSGLDPDDVARSLKTIRKAVKGRVSPAVSARVDNVCTAIQQLLPRANELGVASEEMHVLVRMATDYLPGALEPYLALPQSYAEKKPLDNGRTAEQILCAQLDVMSAQMEEITDAVLRADGDKLLANGRFLEQKFGQRGLELPGSLQPPDKPDAASGPATGPA